MFSRQAFDRLQKLASQFPAVLILGARQVGKTTLARQAFADHVYLDLEAPRLRELFSEDPSFQLMERTGQGLILDEAQSVPGLFAALRGVIDQQRSNKGQFILLGSAQPSLLKGVSESLAGRVGILELEPLTASECATGEVPVAWQRNWLAGGYPDALQGDFREWQENYLRTYVERDLPQLGIAAEPLFARKLLTMLAHQQGGLLNASSLANAMGVSHGKITRMLDVFEQTFLLRRLSPYYRNVGKRLVKSPRAFLRDTGLLHHLLNIGDEETLQSHPIRGASWETFVLENLIRQEKLQRPHAQPYFWRTAAGAEIDLLLDRGDTLAGVEVKAGVGTLTHARHLAGALEDAGATHGWIVDQGPGQEKLNASVTRRSFAEKLDWLP